MAVLRLGKIAGGADDFARHGNRVWSDGAPFARVYRTRMNSDGRHSEARRDMLWPAVVADEQRRLHQQFWQIRKRQLADQRGRGFRRPQSLQYLGRGFLVPRSADQYDMRTVIPDQLIDHGSEVFDRPLLHLVSRAGIDAEKRLSHLALQQTVLRLAHP